MFHPDILRHYTYRVVQCQSKPIDACADVSQYYGLNIHFLASFLRNVEAQGAYRLSFI